MAFVRRFCTKLATDDAAADRLIKHAAAVGAGAFFGGAVYANPFGRQDRTVDRYIFNGVSYMIGGIGAGLTTFAAIEIIRSRRMRSAFGLAATAAAFGYGGGKLAIVYRRSVERRRNPVTSAAKKS